MKNACVVGYGAVGPVHAAALFYSKYANLYAVCDCDRSRLNTASEKYNVKTYLSFDEMLSDGKIDVVHICTPHYLHAEMTLKALSKGKHVVLEKPAAITMEELSAISSAYSESDKKICVMVQNRTNESIAKLLDIVNNDAETGKLLGICGFMTWFRDKAYYQQGSWRGKWATEGGGVVINQAAHLVDLISYIGGGISSVKGSISNKMLDGVIEVEDTADALFKLKNGGRACFYATNTYITNSSFRLEAEFENISYRYADGVLYKLSDTPEIVAKDSTEFNGKKYWGAGHIRAINNFYANLAGEKSKYTDFSDALNSMQAIVALYASAKNNLEILI